VKIIHFEKHHGTASNYIKLFSMT